MFLLQLLFVVVLGMFEDQLDLVFSDDVVIMVVLVSEGYFELLQIGCLIEGLEDVVFVEGVCFVYVVIVSFDVLGGLFIVMGGCVLNVVVVVVDFCIVCDCVYEVIGCICFDGFYYCIDIVVCVVE